MKTDDYRRDLLARSIQAIDPKKASPSMIIPQVPAVGIFGGVVVVVVEVVVEVEVEVEVEDEVVVELEVEVDVEVVVTTRRVVS
ncbi:MAG: hypothetical protein ACREJ6_10260 [Candidatus Methylomirabilis sp.]